MIKKLTKGIEESKLEKERLTEEKEKLQDKFKEKEKEKKGFYSSRKHKLFIFVRILKVMI